MKLWAYIKNVFRPKIMAKTWECTRCGTKYHSEIGREIPMSCRMCGNTIFEKGKIE